MTTPLIETDKRGFRAPGTAFMVSGALIGALGAYLFQVYGGRVLGPEAFAPIGVLWTAMFILSTIMLVPVEQYVTREVASGRKAIPGDLVPAAVMTVLASAVGAIFVVATLPDLFEGNWQYVAQMVLLMVGYATIAFGKGVLAGSRRFSTVGWALIIETSVRFFAGVIAIELVLSATSLGWAMVLGGFSVLALAWWRYDVGEARRPAAPARRFLAGYVGGAASSQLLLAGAPIAVAALGGSAALISIVFFTFTIYRAPLTLIFSLQGRILPYLVGLARDSRHAELTRIARMVAFGGFGLAALGALVGRLVGADVVALLVGDRYEPSSEVAMFAAGGIMAAAAAQVASQVLVAEGRTARLAIAWLCGLVAGVVVMIVFKGDAGLRVSVGFICGELVALGLMAALAVRR